MPAHGDPPGCSSRRATFISARPSWSLWYLVIVTPPGTEPLLVAPFDPSDRGRRTSERCSPSACTHPRLGVFHDAGPEASEPLQGAIAARSGTKDDPGRGMRHRSLMLALAVVWPASACAQTSDTGAAAATLPAVDLSRGIGATLPADPIVARADSLVRAGRSWGATVLLAPQLRTPGTATAQVRLVGARAAAAWRGWTEVERILRDAPWLDTELEGEGRELLARAALERDQSTTDHARRALAAARTDAQRAVRQVLLGRALDRANVRDSAASAYASAAARIPEAADWLRLRAAGVTDDPTARDALLARVA